MRSLQNRSSLAAVEQPTASRPPGRLAASEAPSSVLSTTGKSPRCFASELGGHITPEWELQGNLHGIRISKHAPETERVSIRMKVGV